MRKNNSYRLTMFSLYKDVKLKELRYIDFIDMVIYKLKNFFNLTFFSISNSSGNPIK